MITNTTETDIKLHFTIEILKHKHHLMVVKGLGMDISIVTQPSEAVNDNSKGGVQD